MYACEDERLSTEMHNHNFSSRSIVISCNTVEGVNTYKLLVVLISDDLWWVHHQGLSQAAPLRQSRTAIGIVPLKNGQGDNLSPSNLVKKLEKKHTRRDLFQYRNCKLKQNVESIFYRTFKVHCKVTFQSRSTAIFVGNLRQGF